MRYYNIEGKKYPSVTTVIGDTLPKPELEAWIEKLGKKQAKRIATERAIIGTCGHFRVLQPLSIRPLELPCIHVPWKDTIEWLEEIEMRCDLIEMMWEELNITFEKPRIEHVLYSHKGYAGTADIIGVLHGKNVLGDIKTGKGLWESHRIQMGAYYFACEERGIPIDLAMLIHLHPFEEDNPYLKPKVEWLNTKQLEKHGNTFMELLDKFNLKHTTYKYNY